MFKRSKVIRIFKKGSKSDLNNYGPISIIPIFGKLFEIILKDLILDYLLEVSFFCAEPNCSDSAWQVNCACCIWRCWGAWKGWSSAVISLWRFKGIWLRWPHPAVRETDKDRFWPCLSKVFRVLSAGPLSVCWGKWKVVLCLASKVRCFAVISFGSSSFYNLH